MEDTRKCPQIWCTYQVSPLPNPVQSLRREWDNFLKDYLVSSQRIRGWRDNRWQLRVECVALPEERGREWDDNPISAAAGKGRRKFKSRWRVRHQGRGLLGVGWLVDHFFVEKDENQKTTVWKIIWKNTFWIGATWTHWRAEREPTTQIYMELHTKNFAELNDWNLAAKLPHQTKLSASRSVPSC